ncbi:MAG: disulfide bond formation protein B, partial [Proteobacteria bacterium]|nr:disulfide bond formation protein B [Pseudomonadota bacterium]
VFLSAGQRRGAALLFVVVALAFLANAALGVYHAGVEWKWWAGPQDCSGPVAGLGAAANMLARMQATSLVRCDEAPWRFLGLSLAGYNALISAALAAVAALGAWAGLRRRGN